jgi:hypothetical protein
MGKATSPLDRCTDRVRKTLRLAGAVSRHKGHSDIEGTDILLALWHDRCVAQAALECAECPRPHLPSGLRRVDDAVIEQSPLTKLLMEQARIEARSLQRCYPGTEHLLLALMRIQPELVDDAERVRSAVLMILGHSRA